MLTQTLQPLPDDVMMTMKLYYYDDGENRGRGCGMTARVKGLRGICIIVLSFPLHSDP